MESDWQDFVSHWVSEAQEVPRVKRQVPVEQTSPEHVMPAQRLLWHSLFPVQSAPTAATQVCVVWPETKLQIPESHWAEEEQGELTDNPVHVAVVVEQMDEAH